MCSARALQNNAGSEAQYIYVMWSHADLLIGEGDLVFGQPTSRIPGQTGEWVSDTYGHMQVCGIWNIAKIDNYNIQMKEKTSDKQVNAIKNHQI